MPSRRCPCGSSRPRARGRPCAPRGPGRAPAARPVRRTIARSLASSKVKPPVICACPERNPLADHGRRVDVAVEDDGERLADVLLGRFAEQARPHAVERDGARTAPSRSGRRRTVASDDDVSGEQDLLLDARRGSGAVLSWSGPRDARREPRRRRRPVLQRRRAASASIVDQLELEHGGLADEGLRPRRILDARQLHQDAILALLLDRRLRHAELVDAVPDDLRAPGRRTSSGAR